MVGPGPHQVDRAVVGDSAARSRRSGRCSPGLLLEHFWWGSVFLVTLPLIARRPRRSRFTLIPAHVNETTEPVDNLGGVLSVVLVGALVLAINFAAVPDEGTLALGLAVIGLAAAGRRSCSDSAGRATRSTT